MSIGMKKGNQASASGQSAAVDGAEAAIELINHRTVVGRRRRATTRARIVEAAARVYAEKGLDAPVIDDFVKAADMSRGTFYNHFTTTSELRDATIEWFANDLDRAIIDVATQFDSPAEKTAVAMRIHLQWITADPALCAFFARVPQVGELGRRDARLQLRQGIATGEFEVADLDAACDLVFGVLSETIRRVARSPGRPKRINEVLTLILSGLGVPKERIQHMLTTPLPNMRLPVSSTALRGKKTDFGH